MIKKFVLRILFFSLLFLTCYLAVLFVLSNLESEFYYYFNKYTNIPIGTAKIGGDTFLRFKDIYNYNDLDILFIGSSHCYRGFDIRIFNKNGFKAFNIGSTAQTPLNSYFILKEYLKELNPKFVILDVYWKVSEINGTESFLNLFSNVEFNYNFFKMVFAVKDIKALNGMFVLLFNRSVITPSKLLPINLGNDKYINGGFVQTDFRNYHSESHDKYNVNVDKDQLKYIIKIINYVKKTGAQIILVNTPVSNDYYLKYNGYDLWKKKLLLLAKELNVKFFDFNDSAVLRNKDYFFDKDHLNQNGVEVFNNLLIKILKQEKKYEYFERLIK